MVKFIHSTKSFNQLLFKLGGIVKMFFISPIKKALNISRILVFSNKFVLAI